MSKNLVNKREITYHYILVKGGRKRFGFTVAQIMYTSENSLLHQDELSRWHSLHFTTIKDGMASGRSFPEFFCVKHPNRILWWGIAAIFPEKEVLMVVYFNAVIGCIVHACYLIQLDVATYLKPSLYVTARDSYKSFAKIQLKNNDFGNEFKADRFEYVSKINDLESVVRLSNDNGETWSRYKLTFSPETMTPTLTLIP
jgi:hypothetical protein